jgi:hypothetical protein
MACGQKHWHNSLRSMHCTYRIKRSWTGAVWDCLLVSSAQQKVFCTDSAPEAVEVIRYSAAHLQLSNFSADVWIGATLTKPTADVLLLMTSITTALFPFAKRNSSFV